MGVGAAFLAAAPPCAARDVEIRGTLLCRENGDPLRERPADLPCLLVRSDEYPHRVELVESGALFRLRVPSEAIERPLVLRVYHGDELIDAFRVHLDAGRVVSGRDAGVVSVGGHLLPVDCSLLECDLDLGLEARKRMLATAASSSSGRGRKLSYFLSPVLLLVPGLANGGGGSLNKQIVDPNAVPGVPYDILDPGAFPSFSRTAGSPAIGRSLTSRRHPEEAAIWNPSALAISDASGVSFGAGSMNSSRTTAWVASPRSWRKEAPWAPAAVSAAFLRYSANGPIPATDPLRKTDYEESLFVTGLGFALGERGGLGGSVRYHRLMDETPHRDGWSGRQGVVDFDVSATWDANSWLRLAAAGLSLRGERPDPRYEGDRDSPREAVFGVALMQGMFHGGLELGLREETADLSAGLSVRPFGPLLVDMGGTSHQNAVQLGVESTFGPAKFGVRARSDDLDGFQHYTWVSLSGVLAP